MSTALPIVESRELPVGLLLEPTVMSRTAIDEEGIEELAADIRAKGLINPIAVVPEADRYRVIAGHRRFLAVQRAGLVVVPCRVFPTTEAAAETIKFSENRYRKDLTAAEEAIWFADLLDRLCGGDVDRLCALLGEKRAYVESRLLLFQGDEVVFRALEADKIKIGVAQALNDCDDELQRRAFLHHAILGGATISIVRGWIAQWRMAQADPSGALAPAPVPEPAPVTPAPNYFTCYVCKGEEHPEVMRPVMVHGHCLIAILDKLLGAYHGERS